MGIAMKLAISAAVIWLWWMVTMFFHDHITTWIGDPWAYRVKDDFVDANIFLPYEPTALSIMFAMIMATLGLFLAVYILSLMLDLLLHWWEWLVSPVS